MSFHEYVHNLRTEFIKKLDIKAKSILHLGASDIWYYHWFKENYTYFNEVEKQTGVDLNPRPADLPEEIEWHQKDIRNLDFAQNNTFDMVFAGQFIEHLPHNIQAEMFREVNRVLKKDGYFVFDAPNARVSRKACYYYCEHLHELEYEQAYTIAELGGFNVLKVYGIIPSDVIYDIPKFPLVRSTGGGYTKFPNFDLIKADYGRGLNSNPAASFIYAFITQKRDGIHNADLISKLCEEFYKINVTRNIKIYSSIIGELRLSSNNLPCIYSDESNGPGYVLYGPYEKYPPGKYQAEFIFDKINCQYGHELEVCTLDVVGDTECIMYNSITLTNADFSEETSTRITLNFELETERIMQFRCFSLGNVEFGVSPEVKVFSP